MATRWRDETTNNLNDILNKFLNNTNLVDAKYSVTRIHKVLDENKSITIDEKLVEFNIIEFEVLEAYKVEQVSDDAEIESTKKVGNIVVYKENDKIYYIIDKNSDALRLLRFLLNYSDRSEITNSQPKLTSDMFTWIITLIFNEQNDIDRGDNEDVLKIDDLRGFKGKTADQLNKVAANGDTVMNILSTLSFLLESDLMNQVEVSIEYNDHENIALKLASNNVVTSVKEYSGSFEADQDIQSFTKSISDRIIESEIYLITYIIIIPSIIKAYQDALLNNEWGVEVNKKFLEHVAKRLTDRVNTRIASLDK